MRGLVWSPYYLPADFFKGQVVDEDERTLELPSHAGPRTERCLYIGVQLAAVSDPLSTVPPSLTDNSTVVDGSDIIHLRKMQALLWLKRNVSRLINSNLRPK